MYAERRSVLVDAVVWRSTGGEALVLPDGCSDLLWSGGRLVVAGPDTAAHRDRSPVTGIVGVRFASGVGPAVFGLPAAELKDQRVPLEHLWPRAEVEMWTERVAMAASPGRALEQVAARRLISAQPDPVMRVVAGLLSAGSSVAQAAASVSLSERQLHRRSAYAFGYGPKTLARIFRLHRALGLARSGVSLADCAQRSGCADQAHLAREVRSLTGVTLTELVS